MDRNTAIDLIKSKVRSNNLLKHMLATEAVMQRLAGHFGEDPDMWGMAGLLHDLDYDLTADDFANHGRLSAEWLAGLVDKEIIDAILSHPGHYPRNSRMAKALYAVDPLTGLIVAAALIHPSKMIHSIDTAFILNRFDEKRFAAGANREQIRSCAELELSLEDFVAIGLEAMKSISKELGL